MDLLFQTPWWLPAAIAGMGIVLFINGNRRQEKALMRAGVACLLAALGVALASYLVDTDKEKAEKRTRQLVAAGEQRDWAKFKSLLDPETTVFRFHGPDEITAAAQAALERVNLTTARITGMNIEPTGPIITVTIKVWSLTQGQSGLSEWQFRYERRGDVWKLYEIRFVGAEGVSPERISSELNRGR
jgi:hypothetical protein